MAMIFSSGTVRTALRTKAATDDADFSFGDTLIIDTGYWSQTSLSIGRFLQTTEPFAGNPSGLHPAIPTGDNERAPAQVMAFDGVTIQYADFVPATVGSAPGAPQSSLLSNYIVDGVPFDGDPASANGRFDIVINYTGDPAYASYFQAAAARWSQIITADIPDITLSNGTFVDDLLIDASVAYIDGTGNILAQAGPDLIRSASWLPIHGQMRFDSYDLSTMVNQGIFDEVILHEMGHVLGVGSLWDYFGLRVGNASYYGFTGANALAQYRAMSGNAAATSVPVEPGSRAGSSGVHWSESVFQNELMTPTTGPGNIMPISRLTIASLADLGYTVNLAAADSYLFPGSPNHAPVVTIPSANVAASAGQVIAASSLFSVSDADNDVLTYYLYDATANGGHFVVNGATLTDQTVVALSAWDLAHTTFVAGAAGSSDHLGVLAYDGQAYSGNTSFSYFNVNVAGVNQAPVVTIPSANVAAGAGQSIAASSLFGVTDANNDVLTYFLYDATAGGGHFVINGATVAAQTVVALSAWDLAHTTFVAGAAGNSDALAVMAYDGHAYSGNTSFSYFNVNVTSSLAIEGDNFLLAQGLGQKVATEPEQGIAALPADRFNQAYGASVAAPVLAKADFGMADATIDPLAMFGLHATDHFVF